MINMDFTFEHFLALKNTLMATLTLLLKSYSTVLCVGSPTIPKSTAVSTNIKTWRCKQVWHTMEDDKNHLDWEAIRRTATVLRVFVAEFLHVVLWFPIHKTVDVAHNFVNVSVFQYLIICWCYMKSSLDPRIYSRLVFSWHPWQKYFWWLLFRVGHLNLDILCRSLASLPLRVG